MTQNLSEEISKFELSFIDKIPIGVSCCKLTYKDGEPYDFLILAANSPFNKITRMTNLPGKKISEVLPGLNEANPQIMEALINSALNGEEKRFISFIKGLDICADVLILSLKKDYVYFYLDDITEQKEGEKKLKASESRYRNLFENMAEGFALYEVIRDSSGKVVDALLLEANRAFERQTGMHLENIIGKTMIQLFPQTAPLEIDACGKVASGGASSSKELYSFDLDKFFRQLTFSPEPGKFAFLFDDITERKVAERVLSKSEEKFRSLTENSDDVIMRFDREHKHLYVNPAAAKYFKIDAKDFIGKTHAELGFAKEEYEYWHKRIDDVISQGKPVREIAPVNSGEMWFDWSIIPEFDPSGNVSTVISISRDITGLKKAEKELAEREEYYRKLFEDHEAVQLIMDPMTGRIVDANMAAEKFYGWTRDELKKMNIGDINLMPSEEIQSRIKKVLCHEGTHFEVKQKKADGSIRDVDLYCSTFRREGKEFIQPIIIDVSARKEAEALIKRTNEELFIANAEKDKFFSIIAHDLRSPFHALLGLMEMVMEERDDFTTDEIHDYIAEIHKSGKSVYELLENLLEWANLRRGVLKSAPETLDLVNLIENTVNSVSLRAGQKEIALRVDCLGCPNVFADKHMTETVLRNLLSNAIKYSNRGGEVVVSATAAGDFVEIAVRDKGVGMSDDYAKKLFRMGEKIGTKGTDQEPTSGLGLLLCKEFVEKNGGTIWVESQKGAGSVFRFTLPSGKSL